MQEDSERRVRFLEGFQDLKTVKEYHQHLYSLQNDIEWLVGKGKNTSRKELELRRATDFYEVMVRLLSENQKEYEELAIANVNRSFILTDILGDKCFEEELDCISDKVLNFIYRNLKDIKGVIDIKKIKEIDRALFDVHTAYGLDADRIESIEELRELKLKKSKKYESISYILKGIKEINVKLKKLK